MNAKKGGAAHPRANHPLFPVPVDAQDADLESRDIHWIYVYRGSEVALKKWRFDELTDEEQLFEQYGGGQYTLKARDEAKARWTASRELRLGGPSKPLNEAAPPAPVAAPVAAPSVDVSSPGLRDVLAVASVLGPLLLQYANASAARADAQNALLLQVLARNNNGQNEQIMSTLLAAALQRNPGQENLAMLQNALQLGMQIGAQGGEGDEANLMEQFQNGIGQVIELERLKNERMRAQRPPAPAAAPPPAGGNTGGNGQ